MSVSAANLSRLVSLANSAYQSKIKIVSRGVFFTFSFNYLNKNLEGFDCDQCSNHRRTLNSILEILQTFSLKSMVDVGNNVNNSHLITENELIKRGHQPIVDAFRAVASSNYLQIGPSV